MNIGALIPIRMNSERLPGKALSQIGNKLAVQHLLDRVFASKYMTPKKTIVCTTPDSINDELVAVIEKYGARAYRGSENDLIDRFYHAVSSHGFDAVIQVDGDDITCDTEYMDRTMDYLLNHPEIDVVLSENLPLGLNVKSIRRSAFEVVYTQYEPGQNDTGFGYYFTRSGLCQVYAIQANLEHRMDNLRLTLDYEEDLKVFQNIFDALGDDVFGVEKIVEYANSHPHMVSSNLSRNDEYWERTRDKVSLKFKDKDGVQRTLGFE